MFVSVLETVRSITQAVSRKKTRKREMYSIKEKRVSNDLQYKKY